MPSRGVMASSRPGARSHHQPKPTSTSPAGLTADPPSDLPTVSEDPRPAATLALLALPAADETTMRIFLNFAQSRTARRWALGPVSQADLLLLPLGAAAPRLERLPRLGWVTDRRGATDADPSVLERPYQLDQLVALLQATELAADTPAAADDPGLILPCDEHLYADTAPMAMDEAVPPAPPAARSKAPAAPPTPPAAQPTAPPASGRTETAPDTAPGPALRLSRWPEASSLTAHRYLPRLASFLSARDLTLAQLAALDRKSTRLNSSHSQQSRMPSSA